ncbi:MAG: hypothetical protein ACFCBU_18870 [Cyanophyceae cyanobacterium]
MVSPQFRPPDTNSPRRRGQRGSFSSKNSPQSAHQNSARRSRPAVGEGGASGAVSRRSPQLRRNPQQKVQRKPQKKTDLNRAVVAQTLELSVKLGVNGILGAAAIVGLVKLVPHTLNRHAGLQQIQAEAYGVEARVQTLQQDFRRYFDPKEAEAIARQETIRLAPGQRRVYLQPQPSENPKP